MGLENKYQLPEDKLNSIYQNRIRKFYFEDKVSQEKPIIVILGGQSGSGKSLLVGRSKEFIPNSVTIDADEIRKVHPSFKELFKNPKTYVQAPQLLASDVNKWQIMLMTDCIKNRYNVIVDTTFGGKNTKDGVDIIEAFSKNGYEVHLNVMAVNLEVSKMGNLLRYEKQMFHSNLGRKVSLDVQKDYFKNIPNNIETALKEANKVDKFNVYTRLVLHDKDMNIKNNDIHIIFDNNKDANKLNGLKIFNEERNKPFTEVQNLYLNKKLSDVESIVNSRLNRGDNVKESVQFFKESFPKYEFKSPKIQEISKSIQEEKIQLQIKQEPQTQHKPIQNQYITDYRYFKKNIDLVEFMESYGFQKDKKDSTPSNSIMKRGDQKLCVCLLAKTGDFVYKNLKNPTGDKGSVIDFLKNHENKTESKEIKQVLNEYIGNIGTITPKIYQEKIEKVKEIVNNTWNHKYSDELSENNKDYLNKRGISSETIQSDFFKERIKQADNGNLAFPLYHNKKVEGLVEKNFVTDLFEGGITAKNSNNKSSIWYSKFNVHDKLDKMIIGENPIDLISKYELNKDAYKNQNVVFISTNGSFSENKTERISKFVEMFDPKKIELSFDNDLAGQRFDVNLAGKIKFEGTYENSQDKIININQDITIEGGQKNKNEGVLIIHLQNDKDGTKENNLKEQVLKSFPTGKFELKETTPTQKLIEVTFPNEKKQWEKAFDFTIKVREIKDAFKSKGSSRVFKTDKSESKDFNQDLMNQKALKREALIDPIKGKFVLKELQLKDVLTKIEKNPDQKDLLQTRNKLKSELKDIFQDKKSYYQNKENGKETINKYEDKLKKLGIDIPKPNKNKGMQR